MSKYTTEVRFICESKAGLKESVGCNDVDNVIANSWNKIFTTNCPFFDENYRSILCSKILKHYYLREISAETEGIWQLWVNTKLEEIMPYYNKLYESALLEIDPFKDTDYTKTHEGENAGTKESNGTTTNNERKTGTDTIAGTGTITNNRDIDNTGTASSNGSKTDRYSDTPQGTINNADLDGNAYLTNVRLIGDITSGQSHDITSDDNIETRNVTDTTTYGSNVANSGTAVNNEVINNTDSYVERVFGKMSTTPMSELLLKFRETFLNIDLLVIDEFSELFLQLW